MKLSPAVREHVMDRIGSDRILSVLLARVTLNGELPRRRVERRRDGG